MINIEIFPKTIVVKMPKNEADIQFIRSLKYARWNSSQFCWIVPNYGRNVDLLKSYFGERSPDIIEHKTDLQPTITSTITQPVFTKKDFLVINHEHRTLRMFFSYNRDISNELNRIPMCTWNGDNRCWEIPYSEKFLAEIKQIAIQFTLKSS